MSDILSPYAPTRLLKSAPNTGIFVIPHVNKETSAERCCVFFFLYQPTCLELFALNSLHLWLFSLCQNCAKNSPVQTLLLNLLCFHNCLYPCCVCVPMSLSVASIILHCSVLPLNVEDGAQFRNILFNYCYSGSTALIFYSCFLHTQIWKALPVCLSGTSTWNSHQGICKTI